MNRSGGPGAEALRCFGERGKPLGGHLDAEDLGEVFGPSVQEVAPPIEDTQRALTLDRARLLQELEVPAVVEVPGDGLVGPLRCRRKWGAGTVLAHSGRIDDQGFRW